MQMLGSPKGEASGGRGEAASAEEAPPPDMEDVPF
jgi:hypothetical protein